MKNPNLPSKTSCALSSIIQVELNGRSHSSLAVDIGVEVQLVDLLPQLRILLDPDTDTGAGAHEDTEAIILDLDLISLPAEDIGPDLALVILTDKHALLAGAGITQHDG